MCADLAELVDARVAGENYPVAEFDMACKSSAVGHDAMAADDAIVRDVRIGHEEAIVRDRRLGPSAGGATVDRAELAEYVPVADYELGRFASVLAILRRVAD